MIVTSFSFFIGERGEIEKYSIQATLSLDHCFPIVYKVALRRGKQRKQYINKYRLLLQNKRRVVAESVGWRVFFLLLFIGGKAMGG